MSRLGREADVDQFGGVKITVIIPTCTEGGRDDHSTSVDCLPYIGDVAAPSDLFDEYRSEAF